MQAKLVVGREQRAMDGIVVFFNSLEHKIHNLFGCFSLKCVFV